MTAGGRPARVCVVRQYYYPLDIRVRREVDALLSAGHSVDVVCLRAEGEARTERHGRLTVRRLPMSHTRGGAVGYVRRYLAFALLASLVVLARHLRRPYDLVQVHSLPDTLVVTGLLPKLLGARLVLDLHEVMPEFFATKFGLPLERRLVRLVVRAEQLSIRLADHCLTCTEQMREAFVSRGASADKITVVLNAADEAVFDVGRYPPRPVPGAFTLLCHGSIEERYGLDTVVEALPRLVERIPELRFEVYGSGAYRTQLAELARQRGVADRVRISEHLVPMEELLAAISRADLGVVAMKRDAFRDLTHCNKMYEYISLCVPVVTSRTRSVEAYFPDTALQYFEAGDPDDLARGVLELYEDPSRRDKLVLEAARVAEPYRWDRQRQTYLRAIAALLAAPAAAPRPAPAAEEPRP